MDAVVMYGADWCSDCRRAKKVFERLGVNYEYVDLVETPDRVEEARSLGRASRIPVILVPGGEVLVEPSDGDLEDALRTSGVLDGQPA